MMWLLKYSKVIRLIQNNTILEWPNMNTFIPTTYREQCFEVGVDQFELGEPVVGPLAIVGLQLVPRVQDFDFVGVLVQAGKTEGRVGAQERVDVLHIKLAIPMSVN